LADEAESEASRKNTKPASVAAANIMSPKIRNLIVFTKLIQFHPGSSLAWNQATLIVLLFAPRDAAVGSTSPKCLRPNLICFTLTTKPDQ